MTSSTTAIALTSAFLASVPICMGLWRQYDARMRERDKDLRKTQLARLRSLENRMKDEFVPLGYLDLPSVRLAGLLTAPHDVSPEPR